MGFDLNSEQQLSHKSDLKAISVHTTCLFEYLIGFHILSHPGKLTVGPGNSQNKLGS